MNQDKQFENKWELEEYCKQLENENKELKETMKQGIFSTYKMNMLLNRAERLIEEYVPEEKSHELLEEIFEETNLLGMNTDE
jgi:hypothetical protein